jgi:hypothetical protein
MLEVMHGSVVSTTEDCASDYRITNDRLGNWLTSKGVIVGSAYWKDIIRDMT